MAGQIGPEYAKCNPMTRSAGKGERKWLDKRFSDGIQFVQEVG